VPPSDLAWQDYSRAILYDRHADRVRQQMTLLNARDPPDL